MSKDFQMTMQLKALLLETGGGDTVIDPPDSLLNLRVSATNFVHWLRSYTETELAPYELENSRYLYLKPIDVPEQITTPTIIRQGGELRFEDRVEPIPCVIRYTVIPVLLDETHVEMQNWMAETRIYYEHTKTEIQYLYGIEMSAPLRKSKRDLEKDSRMHMVKKYWLQGLSDGEIADRIGWSERTIRRDRRDLGLYSRGKRRQG